MVGWMLEKVKSAVRDFLKGLLFSVAKRVLLEKSLSALLVSAGKYKKRLDVVVLFEKRKVLFGLEGGNLEVYDPPAEVVAAASVGVEEYAALWAMTSHLPKKRVRVKEPGWWDGLTKGVVGGAEAGLEVVGGSMWDAVEYLAGLSLLRMVLLEVVNGVLAGPLGALGLTLAELDLAHEGKERKLVVGVHLGLKES